MNEYRITETLRELCIRNDWFNAGSNSQYEKMFDLAKMFVRQYVYSKDGKSVTAQYAVTRLTDIIWLCTSDVERESISETLLVWFKQMNKEIKENENDD